MKKIIFIVPWFGKLPFIFPLWLESCRYNKTVDFLLITDDSTYYNYPKNVIVKYCSLDDMRKKIQSLYDFNICLPKAYKLCDFRPAYGEIFETDIKGYDFWGHCDMDLIWGDIRKFIPDDVLCSYNRIFTRGHCTLYKNDSTVNAMYKTLKSGPYQNWKDVFRSSKSCCFDEWGGHCGGGLSKIMKNNNIAMYDETPFGDINFKKGRFMLNNRNQSYNRNIYLKYNQGHLYVMNKTGAIEEIMYAHFQKRKLSIKITDYSQYIINAPGVVEYKQRRHILQECGFKVKYIINKIKCVFQGYRISQLAKHD